MINSILNVNNNFESQLKFDKNKFLLFGAGITGISTLQKLIVADILPIAFIDETPTKLGQFINGIEVISLKQALDKYSDLKIVVTILNPSMDFLLFKENLMKKGFQYVYSFIDLYYSLPHILLPFMHFHNYQFFELNKNKIEESLELFKEQKSVDIFLKNLDFRVNLNYDSII